MKNKRKLNKRVLLVPVLVIILVVTIICIKSCHHKEIMDDGLKYNNNKSFTKKQKVEGIVFKNIKCTYDGENSDISYTIVNDTSKDIYLNNYDIIVKDKNNNRLTKIAAHITETLKPKESLDWVDRVVGVDLTDAYYMELKLNTEKSKK